MAGEKKKEKKKKWMKRVAIGKEKGNQNLLWNCRKWRNKENPAWSCLALGLEQTCDLQTIISNIEVNVGVRYRKKDREKDGGLKHLS